MSKRGSKVTPLTGYDVDGVSREMMCFWSQAIFIVILNVYLLKPKWNLKPARNDGNFGFGSFFASACLPPILNQLWVEVDSS